jgi:hypothetical protein
MNRVSDVAYPHLLSELIEQIFGSNKAKPKPSLNDAISSVSHLFTLDDCRLTPQTDTRIGTIEVKIKKLDAELGAFKAQMAKLRDGPGKVRHFSYCLYRARQICSDGGLIGCLVVQHRCLVLGNTFR